MSHEIKEVVDSHIFQKIWYGYTKNWKIVLNLKLLFEQKTSI